MKILIEGTPVWVNFHHLHCFFVIGTTGSLTTASRALGIGASALSIQMRQLEKALGFALFERSPRKLIVNERGRVVLSYAKEIFRLGGEMVETLWDQPSAHKTHLKVGALDTIPKHLTVQMAEKALKEQKCALSIIEGKPADLLERLAQHQIDLILTNFPPISDSHSFFSRRIARLPLWVVGGKRFLPLKNDFPKSLHDAPFIVPTRDSSVRQEYEAFCKRESIVPEQVAEVQDVMVQKLLALKNLGLTVAPEFAVREYLDKKELYLIGRLPAVFEELFLVSVSRKIENPVASYLVKHFRLS